MATEYCGDEISLPTGITGTFDVVDKYKKLMVATLDDDSLYMQTKKTFYEIFKDLELDSDKKAELVSAGMSQLASQMSASSMQTAIQWAKEERDGLYTLSILHGQALKAQADVLLAKASICKMEADTDNLCAQREVALAGSLRENGRVSSYDPEDSCRPIALQNEGLKYYQTEMVKGQRYSILSDAYMKNGKVEINNNGIPYSADGTGKMAEDIKFSIRQRISFEDSKRNHAANAASQMISGLIASETVIADYQDLVDKWSDAMDYLNTDSTCPTLITGPGCD